MQKEVIEIYAELRMANPTVGSTLVMMPLIVKAINKEARPFCSAQELLESIRDWKENARSYDEREFAVSIWKHFKAVLNED